MELATLLKDFDGRFQGPMKEKFAAPVKDVAFAWIHVRRLLELVCGSHKVAVLFLHLSQKIMQFRGIFAADKTVDQVPSISEPSGKEISQGQIVSVVVGCPIDSLSVLEVK